jgi:V-type H+-transporting ATPase S1 subunit
MKHNGSNFTFGQVNYCQGFFTPAIWMSASASLILIGVLTFALSYLLGINTMDKFDDPKGKPLLIGQEK